MTTIDNKVLVAVLITVTDRYRLLTQETYELNVYFFYACKNI